MPSDFGSLRRGRTYIGGATNPLSARFHTGLNLDTLEQHARGRLEAVAKIVSGVALLTSEGRASHMDHVSYTGAVYQDIKGTPENPRAHRFPCNPKIGIWNIPEIVSPRFHRLRGELARPLAVTDLLPIEANYADSRFEEGGGSDTVKECIEFVLTEQRRGKPPHINLIRHAISHIAMPGFEQAYEIVLDSVETKIHSGPGPIDLADPGWVEHANAASLAANIEPGRPTQNLLSVADVLHFYLQNATELPVHFDPLQLSGYTSSLEDFFKEGKALEEE